MDGVHPPRCVEWRWCVLLLSCPVRWCGLCPTHPVAVLASTAVMSCTVLCRVCGVWVCVCVVLRLGWVLPVLFYFPLVVLPSLPFPLVLCIVVGCGVYCRGLWCVEKRRVVWVVEWWCVVSLLVFLFSLSPSLCPLLSVFLFLFVLVFGVVRAQLCEHARYPRTPLRLSCVCFVFSSLLFSLLPAFLHCPSFFYWNGGV